MIMEVISIVLLAYIAALETISVYKQLNPTKRKYNRKSSPSLKIVKGRDL